MSQNHNLTESIAQCRKAIQQNPQQPDLHIKLGVCLQEAGDLQGAVQCYQQALGLDSSAYVAYNNLGNIFASLGDNNTALTFLRAALQINPNIADIHNNAANLFAELGDRNQSIEHYLRAIALNPENASYRSHLGNVLRQEGRDAEAEDCFRKALELRPDFALARTCLSQMLLRRGDFAAGWAEQEWRWKWKDFPSPKRNFSQPQWRGEEIQGAKILLHAEQGFGDTIQFLRYVPMVAARGAEVLVEVHPELLRLAKGIAGAKQVIARGEDLPAFQWHCPLMSLPLAFSTDLKTIPNVVPYLPSQFSAPAWLQKDPRKKLHVGIVWAGNPTASIDKKRSLTLTALSSVAAVEGVALYSLQRGAALAEIENSDWAFAGMLPSSGDFADTAAAIANLDLVIAVDTSVAHLAGALGKPVWILLPKISDWRWLIDRADSPWYPTARLFRQHIAGQWDSVVEEITTTLEDAVNTGKL